MAYITTSNSKKCIRNLDLKLLEEIPEQIYKWDIYFLSKKEIAILKGLRELFKDPLNFSISYYNPIEITDSFKYVVPESQPAYHLNKNCEKLSTNFINLEVPIEIQEKGKDEVIKYRSWVTSTFPNIRNLDIIDYIYKVQLKFPYVGPINPKTLDYNNSGFEEIENYSLKELENKIDNILRSAAEYYKQNEKIQHIIKRFSKWTFLGYVYGELTNNDSGLTDDELKEFLRNYDKNFKIPLKKYLTEYYKVKFNPDMSFDGYILEKLGFKKCRHCFKENEIKQSSSETNITFDPLDDLPY